MWNLKKLYVLSHHCYICNNLTKYDIVNLDDLVSADPKDIIAYIDKVQKERGIEEEGNGDKKYYNSKKNKK